MLKITIEKGARSTTLRVEGRLTGPWVNELERAWHGLAADHDGGVSVDLTDVTFVGEEGKRLLEEMYGDGAKLKATGCATRRLVEEIGYAFSRNKHTVPASE
jgi:hypothetical protein